MKRILIFSLTYYPYVGGAEVALKEITDRLDKDTYEFHMVTLRFDRALPKVEKRGNITVHRIGGGVENPRVSDSGLPVSLRIAKLLFPITSCIKAYRLDLTYVFDGVWAMMASHAGLGAFFFKLLRPRVPLFLELQDGRPLAELKKKYRSLSFFWPLYKKVFLSADRIKTISHFIEGEVRALGFTKDIEVIPNGVDVSHFSSPASREAIHELEKRVNKSPRDVFVFTASRLVASRGLEDTIRALTFLPQNVRLLIAGAGSDEAKLRALSHDLGLSDRVIFLGYIGHEHLPLYYQFSDIFIRTSRFEGFGNAFIESFAAGLPVVATPVGGIVDFLFDPLRNPEKSPTGLFCDVGNPESAAKAIQTYIDQPELVREVTKNAQKLAKEKYDWNIIAQAMHKKVFSQLL